MIPIRDLNPTRSTAWVTLVLIGLNVAVFVLFQLPRELDAAFFYEWAAIPCELTSGGPLSVDQFRLDDCSLTGGAAIFPDKMVWLSSLSHMFMHGDWGHLLSNMWFLWLFGNNVEDRFGKGWFLLFYLLSGLAAFGGFVALNLDSTVPIVGASGAVAGMLGSYLLLFPRARIDTLVFVFFILRWRVPAQVFLLLWFGLQFYIASQNTNVAWEAHVVGFLFGLGVTAVFKERLLTGPNRWDPFYGDSRPPRF